MTEADGNFLKHQVLSSLTSGNMSLIMMDSGMTHRLAYDTADATGRLYPIFAPFLGLLSAFLTGNNSNANVLFGNFQYTIAQRLGVSGGIMSAAQSLSASVGVSIGPTLVLMGALAGGLSGQESLIYKKLAPLLLIIAFVIGIVNYIMLML